MNRSCLIGCAVTGALLAAAVVLLIITGPAIFQRGYNWVSRQVEQASRDAAFERTWQPPPAEAHEEWFPAVVGEAALRGEPAAVDQVDSTDAELPGRQAKYAAGEKEIDVSVHRASQLEWEAIDRRLRDAPADPSGVKVTTHGTDRLYQRRGGRHLYCRWLKGWLFVFRAQHDPREFADTYLRTISAAQETEAQPEAGEDGPVEQEKAAQ